MIACASLLPVAFLAVGIWCLVSTQRQWLWVFITLYTGALALIGVSSTNGAAPIHARLRRHWVCLALPTVLGLVLGLVAAFVAAEKRPFCSICSTSLTHWLVFLSSVSCRSWGGYLHTAYENRQRRRVKLLGGIEVLPNKGCLLRARPQWGWMK